MILVQATMITYVCPMHPEIKQQGPGECPICGMALEPEITTDERGEDPELSDLRRRFWLGLILTLPIVALEMGGHLFKISRFIPSSVSLWIQFVLSIPVVLWAGLPFFVRGIKSVQQRSLNMFSLVSLGTGVSLLYSIVAVLIPDLFPSSFRDTEGNIPVYFEAASVIVVLVLLGQVLELKARERTSNAIRTLLGLVPKTARLVTNDGDKDVLIKDVAVGNYLRIRPGEKIPVDGLVTEGESYLNESMLTGEPVPVLKREQSLAIAGTLNQNGSLIIKATKIGANTMLARIVDMVTKAQRSRSSLQRLADVVSSWFVPAVIVISILTFIVWGIFADTQGFSYGLIAAVSVLIIACPCALGIATPVSIMVGVGRGAKSGLLIKDAQSLEMMEKINTLIIDKTGTLTEGRPQLTNIHVNGAIEETSMLQLAASLEQNSEHPLALAIVAGAKEKGLKLSAVKGFKPITGKGVTGIISDKQISLGNKMLMSDQNISIAALEPKADQFRALGAIVMFIAMDDKAIGFIVVNDPIKASTPNALKQLQECGMQIIMLTGDNKITAGAVARTLGIKTFFAEVLPADKYKIVEEFKQKGAIVAMAGDGINDAPALAAAHVGIAMGSGTDIAMESAGITLVKGDLSRLVDAINLSRAVMRNIRQNLFLAFIYNAAGIPIAAGILYPFFGILLSPAFAAVAMSLSSLSVIGNALRLNFQR